MYYRNDPSEYSLTLCNTSFTYAHGCYYPKPVDMPGNSQPGPVTVAINYVLLVTQYYLHVCNCLAVHYEKPHIHISRVMLVHT